jgi:flagellum-specific peptidoglycan hydrolase FlgJ
MTKEEFIAAATAAAQASSATSGFPPGVTVAQAALESGLGNSGLARMANNYFGIKTRPGGQTIELPTVEYVDGVPVRSTAKFAKYDSMAECFADRDRMIASLPAYQEARAVAGDPEAFIRALARHWATDPHYAEKLLHVYRAHGLDKLDR